MSGDYQLEDTVYLPFTTRAFATGIPTALVSGAVEIYEDASATQITAAETLTVSLDSVAGFNMITVVATAANGFGVGQSYTAILSAGTVDSVSVVGEVVGHFTIDMSAAAKDLANVTDGLGAIKAETALIVADTNELQTDDVPGLISTLDAVVDTVKAETALIVADTNELQTDDVPGLIATAQADLDIITGASGVNLLTATQASIDAIEADTNELQVDDVPGLISTLDAVVDTVKAETALIVADTVDIQSRLPAALVSGKMDADATAINNSTAAAVNLALSAGQIVVGAAETGTLSSTQMTTDLAEATNDHYIGRIVIFTSGVLAGQATDITDYSGATGLITFSALAQSEAPSNGDAFIIV